MQTDLADLRHSWNDHKPGTSQHSRLQLQQLLEDVAPNDAAPGISMPGILHYSLLYI